MAEFDVKAWADENERLAKPAFERFMQDTVGIHPECVKIINDNIWEL